MYQVKVNSANQKQNKNKEYKIEISEDKVLFEGKIFEWDLVEIKKNYFHILKDNISYRAELVDTSFPEKKLRIKVNGEIYTIDIKDKYDILLEKLGLLQNHDSKISHIKAPMPGLIVDIKINEGTEVKKGDPILILEAMKMENIIKSPGNGIIEAIKVKKGQSVEKNNILIQFKQ